MLVNTGAIVLHSGSSKSPSNPLSKSQTGSGAMTSSQDQLVGFLHVDGILRLGIAGVAGTICVHVERMEMPRRCVCGGGHYTEAVEEWRLQRVCYDLCD
jgi:hypothetical protein